MMILFFITQFFLEIQTHADPNKIRQELSNERRSADALYLELKKSPTLTREHTEELEARILKPAQNNITNAMLEDLKERDSRAAAQINLKRQQIADEQKKSHALMISQGKLPPTPPKEERPKNLNTLPAPPADSKKFGKQEPVSAQVNPPPDIAPLDGSNIAKELTFAGKRSKSSPLPTPTSQPDLPPLPSDGKTEILEFGTKPSSAPNSAGNRP